MAECFDLALKDGVAHLRMCRPEAMNSMTPAFWRELPQLVNELSDGGEARVLVLSSTGKHFTAGMDLAVFQNVLRRRHGRGLRGRGGEAQARLRRQPPHAARGVAAAG
jgi:enoyl-CoA hydratase